MTNGSGVTFNYGGVPTGPDAVNVLHVLYRPLTTPSGQPDPTIAANVRYNRYDLNSGQAYDATITINSAAQANTSNPSSVYYGQPYYQPGEGGYNTVFKKKTMHETGHTMGLCDVPASAQQREQSVMNRSRENCPNDRCGEQPTSVQPCDTNAVSTVANYQPTPTPTPLPTPNNGGGGGGSYCEMYPSRCYGGGGGGGCYDVYEPHTYTTCVGGQCRSETDYEYAYSYCTF